MSGVPEVDRRIRRTANAIFRSQGELREYFTDLFPYIRKTLNHFGLERMWSEVYVDVLTGDFEVDRLAIFLDKLYAKDRMLFVSFIEYCIRDLREKFHVSPKELEWFLKELESLGYHWDGKKLVEIAPS